MRMDASSDESYEGVGASKFKRLPAGRYHVEIIEVDETLQKEPNKIPITFEVLAGTIPGQNGARHTEFFSISDAAMDRLKRLAMVCDLIAPGESKDVSFNDCLRKRLVIEIVPHSYTSEKTGQKVDTTQLDFGGFWKEDHEAVKDVPRGQGSPQPTNKQPPQQDTAATASSGDQWGNI